MARDGEVGRRARLDLNVLRRTPCKRIIAQGMAVSSHVPDVGKMVLCQKGGWFLTHAGLCVSLVDVFDVLYPLFRGWPCGPSCKAMLNNRSKVQWINLEPLA